MKVSLVVASGAHQGKVIPITGPEFLIGRDPQCQLRPSSQAVSKQHCGFIVRDGKVFLKDYGSTNGTVVNDTIVKGEERAIANNDAVKVGPLDFTVRIEPAARRPDGTPLPDLNPDTAAALAAVKAAAGGAASKAAGAPTPMPKSASGSKETPALKTGSKESPALSAADDADHDKIAAMLLGISDDDVPGGSTVVEMPAVNAGAEGSASGEAPKEGEKKDPKKVATREETSNAASEILRKYMRRPK